ncbi:MAG TPA: histidinol-phosphatase HisJ family protein [Cerasibacillus sp.]|uniref:histidinol-phosphatase HisJ family protein n=1 Tax=Cerasibacillus sp. TaxID=2498711 RepID=UPI002F3E2BE6
MIDYHIHSNFSADCETPMEKTIEIAIEKGFSEICFTEHIDYDYPDSTITFEFNLDAYDQKIKAMQVAYADRLAIKKGVEIGVQPHLLKQYDDLLRKESFDFIICSMHTTDRKTLHYGNLFKDRTTEEAFLKYYEELLYCAKHFNHYSVLGHLDLVKRYTKDNVNHDFHDLIEDIFKELIPKGKGIEINTSSFRYGMDTIMPSIDILKLYKKMGGEIITLGSDSHSETTLGYKFPLVLDILKDLGFKYVTTFKKQEPIFHVVEKL